MAPPDLSVAMDCETMDDQTFLETRAKRAAILSAANPANNAERSISRQKINLNNIRDKLEKSIRIMAGYSPDTAQDHQTERFSDVNKTNRLKDLRGVLHEIKRQEDFLSIAKSHSYETAEKVEELEANGKLDEGRAKLVSEIVKQKVPGQSSYKNPYKRKIQSSPYFEQQQQLQQQQPGFFPMMPPQFPGQFMFPTTAMASPQAQMTPGSGSYPMGFNMPSSSAFMPRFSMPWPTKPKVDKSKSSCHACKAQVIIIVQTFETFIPLP